MVVAVPEWTDRVDDDASFVIVLPKERQQNANAVIEPFQQEKTGEEHRNQDKPNRIEIHGRLFLKRKVTVDA
jgi:hypothetical protein